MNIIKQVEKVLFFWVIRGVVFLVFVGSMAWCGWLYHSAVLIHGKTYAIEAVSRSDVQNQVKQEQFAASDADAADETPQDKFQQLGYTISGRLGWILSAGDNEGKLLRWLNTIPSTERQRSIDELEDAMADVKTDMTGAELAAIMGKYIDLKTEKIQAADMQRKKDEADLRQIEGLIESGFYMFLFSILILVVFSIERNTRK